MQQIFSRIFIKIFLCDFTKKKHFHEIFHEKKLFPYTFRCSSLDDLQWVTSAAEMSQLSAVAGGGSSSSNAPQKRQDFHMNHNSNYRSNTLPTQPSVSMRPNSTQPTSIMKKNRASNPVDPRRWSGAIKVDLSTADKTIRRPSGSEPDLGPGLYNGHQISYSQNASPMRSSIKAGDGGGSDPRRHSGISTGSSKKVMFSGGM